MKKYKTTERFGSQSGMSLISVMVAVGITAVMMLSIAQMFANAKKSQRATALSLAYVDLLSEVKGALDSGPSINCNENLRRATNAAGSPDFRQSNSLANFPIQLSYFSYIEPPPGPTAPPPPATPFPQPTAPPPLVVSDILKVGQTTADGLQVKSLEINPRAWIGNRLALVDLEIDVVKTGEVAGPKIMRKHTLPIFLSLDNNGQFVSCSTHGFAAEQKLCALKNDPDYKSPNTEWIFNNKTGKCVPKKKLVYIEGPDLTSAACPFGSPVTDDGLLCTISNIVDPLAKTFRDYGGGAHSWGQPLMNARCDKQGDAAVKCTIRDDLIPHIQHNSRCSIGCMVNNPDAAYDPPK